MNPDLRSHEWLLRFSDPERGVGWNPRSHPDPAWNTRRSRALLELLGAPDRAMRCVLVAGTKGKGSTAAFLASVLAAAGVRAGLYTGPHLQSYRERIVVDGGVIGPADFSAAVERLRPAADALRTTQPEAGEPTTFELLTALALDHFARSGCEIAVLEVGLGGRLDATNATEPGLSIITPIGHDHTQILGRQLATIAAEKAGVLRRGRPALLSVQRPAAAAALRRACRSSGAACHTIAPGDGGSPVALYGAHQLQNAALAAAAARLLARASDQSVRRGLAQLHWPGRFELVGGSPEVVLDGAHNPASAEALARALASYAAGRPIHLVIGLMRDKDARGVLQPLTAVATSLVVTRPRGVARGLEPAALAAVARRLGMREVDTAADLAEALARARNHASRRGIVCVTGSLALVGEARTALGIAPAERLWDAVT